MNPYIFREYDIRGLAEIELTNDVALKIGRAFGTTLVRDGARTAVVGRDVRLSSERLSQSIVEGLSSTGLKVLDVGVVPTPILYFSIYHYRVDGGLMVTGSHNPKEYNGFKMCRGTSTIYGPAIQELRALIERHAFASGDGSTTREDPSPMYMKAIKERVTLDRRMRVVIDAGNGTSGPIASKLFDELGADVDCLYCDPDGRFPNHLPDPTVEEYIADLVDRVRTTEADLGIGYDGDADRIGVVDETGNIVWGDRVLGLFAQDLLERRPGAKIIFDVKCSQALVEFIRRLGGQPIMWKTGHSLIKAKMKEEGSLLAGEMSGHMFFAEDYYGYDDAIFASARLLQILSRTESTLSQLASEIPFYYATPEIRVKCDDARKFEVVAALHEYFSRSHEVISIDGVRVIFDGGWGLVRASNTQPVLVLRFEAKTKERLAEIGEIIRQKLSELGVEDYS